MSISSVLTLADEIYALLPSLLNLKRYDGEIPQGDEPPTYPDGRIKGGYIVFYGGPGLAIPTRLCAKSMVEEVPFQVTCVGGDRQTALWTVDQVRAAITDTITASGVLLSERFDPETVRRDDAMVPPRHYVPLQFIATA